MVGAAPSAPARRTLPAWVYPACLLAGLVGPQVLEYGPSLLGQKVLLPLDLLALPRIYLPNQPEYQDVKPQNQVHLDEVLAYEPARRFAAAEVRAGRYPAWYPYGHCGVPFIFPVLSPFAAVYLCWPDPAALAWMQLLKTLVAGLGAYWFFRVALQAGYWPAALGAWCLPLSGYLTLWQGHYLSDSAAWLPWVLLATDRLVRRPGGWGGPGLALALGLTALCGGVDVVGAALLASGLYALFLTVWLRGRPWRSRLAWGTAAALAAAWCLGPLLAAGYLLPQAEFARSGSRIQERAAGVEERPPVGWRALPLVVLPFWDGSNEFGSVSLGKLALPENTATAYAGLLAALVAAPLAFSDPRRSPLAWFWLGLALVGISWQLNLPLLVSLWRLPGLNLCSHNRFTLLANFSLLALAVLGLDALAQGMRWRRWYWGVVAALALLLIWSLVRLLFPPALLIALQVPPEGLARFASLTLWGVLWCTVGLAAWLGLYASMHAGVPAAYRPGVVGSVLGALLLIELIGFGWGYNPQAERRLYYPPLPVAQRLAGAPEGRILGANCLPPNLAGVFGLRDVRGYDAVDPRAYVELLLRVADPMVRSPEYARTQFFVPKVKYNPQSKTVRVPPVLSMLGMRYLLFRGRPAATIPVWDQGDDYFVVENAEALPRVFIPKRVEPAPRPRALLERLTDDDFEPAEARFVAGAAASGPCRGSAAIVDEVPDRITIEAELDAPGWLVLTDEWFPNWEAEVEGQAVPVRRANHAFRGVELPAGRSTVVFAYRPAALRRGLLLAGCAAGAVLLWFGGVALGALGAQRAARLQANRQTGESHPISRQPA